MPSRTQCVIMTLTQPFTAPVWPPVLTQRALSPATATSQKPASREQLDRDETSPGRGGPYLPGRPPVTFRANPRPRSIRSREVDRGRTSPRPSPMRQQLPSHLPPIGMEAMLTGSDYQHQMLIPRSRGPSAYITRHHASHGILSGSGPTMGDTDAAESMGPPPAVRTAILRALAMNAEMMVPPCKDAAEAATQAQWKNTSVGDLEALDTILDQLVVTDARMREALLRGPLVSFETVVPEPASASRPRFPDDSRDTTFITAVPGGIDEGGEGEGKDQHIFLCECVFTRCCGLIIWVGNGKHATFRIPLFACACHVLAEDEGAQILTIEVEAAPKPSSPSLTVTAPLPWATPTAPPTMERPTEMLRESIPVPILPKLGRMYITTRQAQERQAPPLPPPTAEFLVRTRPPPSIAAPSYDELCSQIRDVQKQYTCGTAKDRNVSPGKGMRVSLTLSL